MSIRKKDIKNQLLACMGTHDFDALAPHLDPVDLPRSFVISHPDTVIEHYYFIEAGLGSIVCVSQDGFRAEVGMVGKDGVIPVAAIFDRDSSAHQIVMQVGGHGHRIDSAVFKEIMGGSETMRRLLLRFASNLSTQASYTALSNAVHHVEERLARWLLMCHDRIGDEKLKLTHEYLAVLLAVRRPSVTTALHILEGNRFIYATRGLITIRDREGLQRFAADAYGVPEAEYRALFGPLP
ncbi:cAMP-binding domain of CRP or a regulatory subunit of cAMP-dependent protein kinases [Kaistia soli DSM 19436]|uniref:cAMP-binding domain of CRP or a regulatory subunit of cAMP-dependent protein kinases n=1 Tax=Kaistia soli DSM 19436 TaxID=1122133 RepID=A0A1M5PHC3_9HYPH|nr:Crp/Fnr family transcriptional regulator [Kaistia soli]SHH01186.1 cAMP-binding domain of CRP or a regulatory subunit of cAMP-dependent protein kinases [Kaistia soli DSM 19436]